MTPKSKKKKEYVFRPKFRPGETVYFKSPSRYSRSRANGTVEAIIQIVDVQGKENFRPVITEFYYLIKIIKLISGKQGHWSSYTLDNEPIGLDSLEIEVHSRRLTPAERVLYG